MFHEMCHEIFPPFRNEGKTSTHHKAFKEKEREFERYEEARRWEKAHWTRLMQPEEEG